jgi:cell division protein FtsI (penicillin-binding protein 3)
MVPARKPRLLMVVVVNEPKAGVSGGGKVAAPIFSRIAERSLRLLGVPPDTQFAAAAKLQVLQGKRG